MKVSEAFTLPLACIYDEDGVPFQVVDPYNDLVIDGESTCDETNYDVVVYAINNHDRLTEENAKLRQEKEILLHELCSIQSACIGQIAMGYSLDAEVIGQGISIATGMTNPELNKLLKDQNNDK